MKQETVAWLASADHDADAATFLLDGGFYMQAIFYVHLSVEKVLKALIVERSARDEAPRTHNLVSLLERSRVDGLPGVGVLLGKLSMHATASRYTLPPASSRYTAELARELSEESHEATVWLRQQLT